ncbi:MAG: acetyl-CoA carboxylase, biotin carboxyl carrier protein [uncultured bacterium]|nr:MAG: acetyl-CoA carboxylase, biotin carboxyl carrier protein [uncultured bacterium]HBC71460.1 acetyl-CoA carboxylase biotin carboxyl carrier protein [Coxiellaceae bacterium]HBS51590.1 acetyl-CoA carboxylase biotin carboxyl carrier protein [Coxiellaceae bacterium]HBY55752.1 acetyl-CoA carboxylase biotin carboxyl carrier protein [Coxiellaceae bacterium]
MDIRKIKKLIDLINENNIAEIEIREEKESIHIVLNKQNLNLVPNEQPSSSKIQTIEQNLPEDLKTTMPDASKAKNTINSPMVGTVYLSATPGAKHFVEAGQKVKVGDTLCLIEAMKTYNKIEADKSGTITARLVENSQPVEYNQPLFAIELNN